MSKQKQKIGLALGAGGFRGYSQIGVIQVLQENNIPIDFLSGASIGSLVAAYFSLHEDVGPLEDEVLNKNKDKIPNIFDLGFKGGLVSGEKFEDFLERVLGNKTFNDCRIPLQIVATDLKSGQAQILKQGPLAKAVQASSSVPLIFEPVPYRNQLLVDGALSNPVPVKLLQEAGADKVIAVNLYHQNEFTDMRFNFPNVALRATRIAIHNLAKNAVLRADVVLNPDTSAFISDLKYKKYFDPEVAKKLMNIGRREALRHLPEIKKLISS